MVHFLHSNMRKPPALRLTSRWLVQLVGGRWFPRGAWRAFGLLTWVGVSSVWLACSVWLAAEALGTGGATLAAPAGQAAVTIEFLADGRCHVSADGQGFRSNATYTPQAAASGDLRCAMPPVPQGLSVALKVVVPPGTPRPGSSQPQLEWQTAPDGRWSGTASMAQWPDAVVVRARPQTWTLWAPSALAALIGVVGVAGLVELGRRRARLARAV